MLLCAKCTCLPGLESYAKTLHNLPSSPARGNRCLAISRRYPGHSETVPSVTVGVRSAKSHLPGTLAKAQHAEVVCEATSLLARVESLMQESEKIAAAAKLEKNWPAATSALREARGCLELLGRLRGELQQPGPLHLHKHAHIHAASQPRNEFEIELEIARHVAMATANFDAQEIIRLKGLLEVATPQS